MRQTPPDQEHLGAPGTEPVARAGGPDWLGMAREAYEASTSWLQSIQKQIDDNLALFQNRHPTDSKYLSGDYTYRSKVFRPKTRATVRRGEAMTAASFFATNDVVSIAPRDDNDVMQAASAELWKAVLQHRLGNSPVWFLTVLGAYQDTSVQGLCISKQYWRYEERETGDVQELVEIGDDGAERVLSQEPVTAVVADKPVCDLIPIENFRIDPAADWRDPVATSPYLIHILPMYVGDIRDRMARPDPKSGQPAWFRLDDGAILAAVDGRQDATRMARERDRTSSIESGATLTDDQVVFVHENFRRIAGVDWVYYTLGSVHLLSEPRPAAEVYRHADRPFVIGYQIIEAHKTYPASKVALTAPLQQEANDIANLRLDNQKMVLAPKPKVRAGVGVALEAVRRHVPGEPLLMKDPLTDVVWDRPPDVTASAYAEQDRINVDFDDIAGSFSGGSVMTNRQLNETVGGMQLLAGAAATVGDYDIRVFAETWAEPVLRQLLRLEQLYETDLTVLALAGRKAELVQRYGIDRLTDELLDQQLTLSVNVGIGATDPMTKINKFAMGTQIIGKIFGPAAAMAADFEEVTKEVFGLLGYKDGARFFKPNLSPQVVMLQQALQELQGKLAESKKGDPGLERAKFAHERQVDLRKIAIDEAKLFVENGRETARQRMEAAKMMHGRQMDMDRIGLERSKRYDEVARGLGMAADGEDPEVKMRELAAAMDRLALAQARGQDVQNAGLQAIAAMQQAIAQGQNTMAQLVAELIRVQRAPRRVVPQRDEQGRMIAATSEIAEGS